jgi:hypothetical protein
MNIIGRENQNIYFFYRKKSFLKSRKIDAINSSQELGEEEKTFFLIYRGMRMKYKFSI